jgi:hypothetical protein
MKFRNLQPHTERTRLTTTQRKTTKILHDSAPFYVVIIIIETAAIERYKTLYITVP